MRQTNIYRKIHKEYMYICFFVTFRKTEQTEHIIQHEIIVLTQ